MDVDTPMPAWPLSIGPATNGYGRWPPAKPLAYAEGLGISAHISPVQSDPHTRSGRVQVCSDTPH